MDEHEKFFVSFSFCFLVETSFGPMSRDVDGLVQGMRALWDGYMFDLDPSVVPMTFHEEVSYSIQQQCRYCHEYLFYYHPPLKLWEGNVLVVSVILFGSVQFDHYL